MRIFIALLIATCLFMPRISSAGVIYEWKGIGGNKPEHVSLTMEFDHDTVASGAFSLELQPRYPDEPYHSGLSKFQYSGGGVSLDFGRDNFALFGYLSMHFVFEANGSLSGEFFINNSHDEVAMSGADGVWTLLLLSSDDLSIQYCGRAYSACDANGLVRRTDIPEPGSAALLAIGVAAAGAIRRRKRV